MKNRSVWTLIVVMLVCLNGCTTYTKVHAPVLEQLGKTMKTRHNQIRELDTKFSPSKLVLTYWMNGPIEEADRLDIFYQTKETVLSSSFQTQVIEDQFFKKYVKAERIYPSLSISFRFPDQRAPDCSYESSYYKTSDVSSEEARSKVDGYQTWFFRDYRNEDKLVPPQPK
ncbi:hypothetical protein SD70_23400 [Gordoniibacillus kamchatkensis]|uniref:Lipoprotein n=1 Tax=Gordoniibacillus kamchatkensis TaxID=1590651 RepID=A0ABR5ACY8_9BACL|nr:hypothetical protein [Paenibacillus sp. VKM B-2647]KIL38904.1 hypothetical protein SD70_23400 [Paenibacillus sp. VKM B-2647]